MSLTTAIIDALMDAGVSREQIAAAMKADIADREKAEADRIAAKRVGNRERQQRKRARTVPSRSVTAVTRDATPNEYILTPTPVTPEPSGSGPTKSKPRERGSRLAEDWTLPAEWAAWAKHRRRWSDADIAEEALIFANHWQAKTGAAACHTNWLKVWQNWVIRSYRKDGAVTVEKPRKPLTTAELQSAVRFHRDRGDEDRAVECERQLERLRPPPAQIVQFIPNMRASR